MPLGSFRLNTLSQFIAAAGITSARASTALYRIASPTRPPSIVTTSGKFNGYASYQEDEFSNVTVYPTDTSFYYNSNKAWTIEWWWKKTGTWNNTTGEIWFPDGLSSAAFSVYLINATQYSIYLNSSIIYTGTLPTSWQHFALVCNGFNNLKVFVNGSQVASVTYSRTDNLRKFNLNTAGIGAGNTLQFDELRVSNNARYTSGFTPSSTAFVNSANTLALFHFDTDFADDSELGPVDTLLTYVGNIYASGATSSSLPAAAQVGDIVFVIDTLRGTGSLSNFRTPIANGGQSFTEHQTTSGGTASAFIGVRISSKVLASGEIGTITNLIDNADTTLHNTDVVVFRPTSPITSVSYTQTGGQYTTSNPSVQTVSVASQPKTALAMAIYMSSGSVSPRTSSITMVERNAAATFYTKYKLYTFDESRTNFTVDMDDEGTNLLQSFYVKLN